MDEVRSFIENLMEEAMRLALKALLAEVVMRESIS